MNGPTTSPNSYNDVLIGFWAKTQYSILNTQYIPAYPHTLHIPSPKVQIFHVNHLPGFWTVMHLNAKEVGVSFPPTVDCIDSITKTSHLGGDFDIQNEQNTGLIKIE